MVKIEELSNQNPWWRYGNEFSHYDNDLIKLHDQRVRINRKRLSVEPGRIATLRGPRQVGKTTYMKTIIYDLIKDGIAPRRIMYLSVDRFFSSRRELRDAVDYFLDRNLDTESTFIFLDEITAIKDWNLELKYLSDSGAARKAGILVTGSSGEALKSAGEQLPGRGLEGNEFYMKPLSFRDWVLQTSRHVSASIGSAELARSLQLLPDNMSEAIKFDDSLEIMVKKMDGLLPFKRELNHLFGHYLRCGGYPIVLSSYLNNALFQKNRPFSPDLAEMFVRTVLGEVTKYGKSDNVARQILRSVIEKYGSKYSFTKLSNETEVTRVTTEDYLIFLENSFILSVLYAYNFGKREVKYKGGKKVFFQDPFLFYGIKSALSGQDINEVVDDILENEELRSIVIEGIVFSHLAMSGEVPYLREPNTFLWFYYDEKGREIDNLVRRDDSILGIEVKYRNNVGLRDVYKMAEVKDYIILSKEDYCRDDHTIVTPVEIFLALLERSSHNL